MCEMKSKKDKTFAYAILTLIWNLSVKPFDKCYWGYEKSCYRTYIHTQNKHANIWCNCKFWTYAELFSRVRFTYYDLRISNYNYFGCKAAPRPQKLWNRQWKHVWPMSTCGEYLSNENSKFQFSCKASRILRYTENLETQLCVICDLNFFRDGLCILRTRIAHLRF